MGEIRILSYKCISPGKIPGTPIIIFLNFKSVVSDRYGGFFIEERKEKKMKLTKYEQETIINFNAADKTAEVYTRDPAVMRQMHT